MRQQGPWPPCYVERSYKGPLDHYDSARRASARLPLGRSETVRPGLAADGSVSKGARNCWRAFFSGPETRERWPGACWPGDSRGEVASHSTTGGLTTSGVGSLSALLVRRPIWVRAKPTGHPRLHAPVAAAHTPPTASPEPAKLTATPLRCPGCLIYTWLQVPSTRPPDAENIKCSAAPAARSYM